MKKLLLLFGVTVSLLCCTNEEKNITIEPIDWSAHYVQQKMPENLETGTTYLSIYPEIYSFNKHKTHDLTTLVSLRNISETDSIYISRADYYNTRGDKTKTYLKKPIYLKPMETIEIVIAENDSDGTTGSNFIFKWHKHTSSNEPFFEAVMSSTMAQQGLSFTTQGLRIN